MSTGITQGFREGEDWIVLFAKEEDRENKKLTGKIITLRKVDDYYRRDDEIHHVRLYDSSEITEQLRQVGFQVQTMNNYGQFQLSPAHTVFIAQKKG